MSKSVLDASALLALLHREKGHEIVAEAIADGATISAVNLAEVVAKLTEGGVPATTIRELIDSLNLDIADFGHDEAYQSGFLRLTTRSAGLSLGDRCCLAVGMASHRTVLTMDRAWASLGLEVDVRVVR